MWPNVPICSLKAGRGLGDEPDHRGQLAARHGDVLEDGRRPPSRQRGEGVASRRRRAAALRPRRGRRERRCARCARAIVCHLRRLVGDRRGMAVGFHQQHRRAVGRQADVGVVLDAARRHPIEELERARDDPRGDDRRDRVGSVLDPIVEREHRPPRRGPRHQLQQHFGDDAERAFRSDEQILQRVAGDVLHAPVAEPGDLAVRQHDLEAHHVVARDAVLQARAGRRSSRRRCRRSC